MPTEIFISTMMSKKSKAPDSSNSQVEVKGGGGHICSQVKLLSGNGQVPSYQVMNFRALLIDLMHINSKLVVQGIRKIRH